MNSAHWLTTLNPFLFTEPLACSALIFACARSVDHLYFILLERSKSMRFSPLFPAGEKFRGLFIWCWLRATDRLRWGKKQWARKVNVYVDWWSKGYDAGNKHTDTLPRWPQPRHIKPSLVGWPAVLWEHKERHAVIAISARDLLKRNGTVMSFIYSLLLTFTSREVRDWDKNPVTDWARARLVPGCDEGVLIKGEGWDHVPRPRISIVWFIYRSASIQTLFQNQ